MITKNNAFKKGMKDAIPIALGYLAVGFSLGIPAKQAGLSPFQGFMTSLLGNASAGEYVVFSLIAANATYIELIIGTLVTNARYLLMSASLSQRLESSTSLKHRLMIAFDVTDELFGIGIAHIQSSGPYYMYGAYSLALPAWSIGTGLGVVAGQILPIRFVSALSVALYGMFLAIVIPPAKKDKTVRILVILSFIASFLWQFIPMLHTLSDGMKTIILTCVISLIAAIVCPRKDDIHDA